MLVDTSVWVAHFKRRGVIQMLSNLDQATVATTDEVLALIDRLQLHDRGCGFVDVSLLISTLLS